MTRRVVLRISGIAKLGLLAGMVGVGLGGAALYVIERFRFWRRPRD